MLKIFSGKYTINTIDQVLKFLFSFIQDIPMAG